MAGQAERSTLEDGGGPPHNGGVEARLSKLETQFETVIPTLSTKADMAELRTDFAELRADMHKMDANITKWIIATILGLFFGFSGLFFTMSNTFKPTSVPASAPIVITIPAQALPPATPSK